MPFTGRTLYNDTFGIPTHVVDFNGNVTTYTLDSHGNITQRTDPDGQSENYTYNSAGQVLTDTDPLGQDYVVHLQQPGPFDRRHRARNARSRPSSTATTLPVT